MICDADVIRRVLENLISNAVKFTTSDGTIRVKVQRNAADVTISVSDDGHGIAADRRGKILKSLDRQRGGNNIDILPAFD